MNNAGSSPSRLIVILNDNDMSIAPPVGAMSAYLSRLLSSKSFMSLRQLGGAVGTRHFLLGLRLAGRAAPRNYARGMIEPAALLSRSSAFIMSARSTAIISTICSRCCRT